MRKKKAPERMKIFPGREGAWSYEIYNARFRVPADDIYGNPRLTSAYDAGAERLARHVPNGDILELESRTGLLTLRIAKKYPDSRIVCAERNPFMISITKYKFHQTDGQPLRDEVNGLMKLNFSGVFPYYVTQEVRDTILWDWDEFRKESEDCKDRVEFFQCNYEVLKPFDAESFDVVTGHQAIHQGDIPRIFRAVNRVLKPGSKFIWTTASQIVDNKPYWGSKETGFRYNNAIGFVTGWFAGRGLEVKNYLEQDIPEYPDIESIIKMTEKKGFKTEHIDTFPLEVNEGCMVEFQIPLRVRNLIESEIDPFEYRRQVDEAINEALTKRVLLRDREHRYDNAPVFRSTKIKSVE